mgnify:CR=1 FL=1
MYFDPLGMTPPEKLDHYEWIPLQIQNMEFFKNKFIERKLFEEYGFGVVRRHFYAFKN